MAAPDYDVLIIGSGASGGMAAYVLTRLGVKCLILEAGPPVDFQNNTEPRRAYELPFRGLGDPARTPHVWQADEFNAHQWVDERVVPYTHPPGEPFNWVRARYVGGKSLFWSRMSFRLSDYEFKAASWDGFGEDWPIRHADLDPYYSRVEQIFRVRGRPEGLPQLPDANFQVIDDAPDSPAQQLFIERAKSFGIPVTKLRSSLGRGPLASSTNLLLPEALATGNLTIVPNAVVRELSVDRNTGLVDGANFVERTSGRDFHAKARVVVLGASCLESTRILLNSGIANSSGVLGHYLFDQFYIGQCVQAVIPEVRDRRAPPGYAGGVGYIPRFRNINAPRERNFIRGYAFDFYTGVTPREEVLPFYGPELDRELARLSGAGFTATCMGEVLPRFENHVRINKNVTDAYGIPVLHISMKYSDNEFNMAKDAIATLSEVCRACGWEVLSTNEHALPPGYSIHELGTCRMGDNPRTSVLNKWNQSHDVKNLFVVDGSSFVTGGSQNPTMTIAALAMRASEYLAEEMRRGNL
jgi:choline dehydrogenase-like flavoprotein